MHTQTSGDMQYICMPQCGVVGKGCGIYIGDVRWWGVYIVECLGMYDGGVSTVWKVYSVGYVWSG